MRASLGNLQNFRKRDLVQPDYQLKTVKTVLEIVSRIGIHSSDCMIEESGRWRVTLATSHAMLRFRSAIAAWPMSNISARLDGSGTAALLPVPEDPKFCFHRS